MQTEHMAIRTIRAKSTRLNPCSNGMLMERYDINVFGVGGWS